MKATFLSLSLVLLNLTAYAKPPLKTIYSCTTTNGKQLAVYRQGNNYIYSFGRKGHKPELPFKNPRKNVLAKSISSEKSDRGGVWWEMPMTNRAYEYIIFFRVDKHGNHEITEGVEVGKLGNNLNDHRSVILCDSRYPSISNLEINEFR